MTMVARADQVLDDHGAPVLGASIYVYDSNGNSASLTSDGATALPQPLITDEFGNYSYQALVGYYREDIWYGAKLRYRENNIALGSPGADLALRSDLAASTGSGLVDFTGSATGAVARTLQSKLNDFAHARDFGLVGSGDETTRLTNFVNSAIANPGIPHRIELLTYGISSPLPTISVDGVIIEGVRGTYHDVSSKLSGAIIKWVGALNAGKMLTVTPATGASAQILTGVAIRGVAFDCNSLIATGVRVESVRNCEFVLSGANSTSVLFDLGVTSGTLGESLDLQNNIFRLYGRQVEQTTGVCLQLGGNSTANASFNDFWCELQHMNAPAVICSNSDNNRWNHLKIFCSGTATESIRLLGGATSGVASRAERFLHFTANKPPKVYGTADYVAPSTGHRFTNYDLENSTPAPVLGIGAWVDCEMPQAYTPAVTGTGGTGLTTGTILGSYIRNNDFADVDVSVQVTAGSGYTSLTVTLPFAAAGSVGQTAQFVEAGISSKSFNGYIAPGTSNIVIHSPDGTTAIPVGSYVASVRYRVR